MAKYKVEAREIIYHQIIIEAESLDDAYNWINLKHISEEELDIEWETENIEPLESEVE